MGECPGSAFLICSNIIGLTARSGPKVWLLSHLVEGDFFFLERGGVGGWGVDRVSHRLEYDEWRDIVNDFYGGKLKQQERGPLLHGGR